LPGAPHAALPFAFSCHHHARNLLTDSCCSCLSRPGLPLVCFGHHHSLHFLVSPQTDRHHHGGCTHPPPLSVRDDTFPAAMANTTALGGPATAARSRVLFPGSPLGLLEYRRTVKPDASRNTDAQAARGGFPLLASCVGNCSSAVVHRTLHITRLYRRQLRPSSRHEPRHPPWRAEGARRLAHPTRQTTHSAAPVLGEAGGDNNSGQTAGRPWPGPAYFTAYCPAGHPSQR
jgi:hypothetical protein